MKQKYSCCDKLRRVSELLSHVFRDLPGFRDLVSTISAYYRGHDVIQQEARDSDDSDVPGIPIHKKTLDEVAEDLIFSPIRYRSIVIYKWKWFTDGALLLFRTDNDFYRLENMRPEDHVRIAEFLMTHGKRNLQLCPLVYGRIS